MDTKEKVMNRNSIKALFSLAIMLVLAVGLVAPAAAQTTRRSRNADWQLRDLTQRIRVQSDNFRASFDAAIQNIRLRGTEAENINRYINDFERALTEYDDRLQSRQANVEDAKNILDAAANINGWLRTTRLNARVERDWSTVRTSLTQLAREYNLSWNGDSYGSTYPNNNYPRDNGGIRYDAGLTGTFRLDESRSDNARDVADRAVYQLPTNRREEARQTLEQRLETPEGLAIERSGRQVTIASTRAPRYTFEADGRDKYETTANGNSLRVRSTLFGERLEVTTSGNRGNDYTVTFEPFDGGRGLRVVRRLTTDFLRTPVTVTSVYERTSDVAQLDLYDNPNQFPGSGSNTGGNRRDDYIIANNTTLRATVNESISTKTANENDRFTMTVQTPDEYKGAIIEGYVSGVQRSGRATGRAALNFNFETIRLRDGRSYNFAGFVESIRNANGDEIKINNEGRAQGGSQTKQTATRGAVGAAVGALIGAIAGGGKGAAIGAIIGGGAGAGSVYIEGREDLELNSGSDVYIRATAPARYGSR
jgi:hypothetical protein